MYITKPAFGSGLLELPAVRRYHPVGGFARNGSHVQRFRAQLPGVCSVSNQTPSFSRAGSAISAALRLFSANISTASASFLRAVSSVSPRLARTRVSVGQAMSNASNRRLYDLGSDTADEC